MKKLILFLLLLPAVSFADKVDVCQDFAMSAAKLMDLRQQGVDMSYVLQRLKDFAPAKTLIMAAWEVPLYSTDQYKRKAIVEFKNMVFHECLKGLEEAKNGKD